MLSSVKQALKPADGQLYYDFSAVRGANRVWFPAPPSLGGARFSDSAGPYFGQSSSPAAGIRVFAAGNRDRALADRLLQVDIRSLLT